MLRTAVLLAGLGAALLYSGWQPVSGHDSLTAAAMCQEGPAPWKVQCVTSDVIPGQPYRLDGCLTVSGTDVDYVGLRVVWYAQPGGFGSSLDQDDQPADEQCPSLTNAVAPCAAASARYGVVVKGNIDAVEVTSLQFAVDPGGTPVPCPTPALVPTATPTPTPTAIPSPQPTPVADALSPPAPPEPTPTAQPGEPVVFPSLVNGGFEDLREDGTPYGWHKVGGEMSASNALRAEGERSAALLSRTESTKWIYQTVSVEGGAFYQLRAAALKNDPGVREALLRLSWYESADGGGSQIGTADSPALSEDSPAFVTLDTGPVQAPPEALSVKVRLLLRPASAAAAALYFDDVRFGETNAPPPLSAADAGQAERPAGGRQRTAAQGGPEEEPGAQAPTADAVALSAWIGPTPLANVGQEPQPQAAPDASGGRPLWPLLLALGVPAAALATVAGHGWWRTRLAGRNEGHL